MSPKSVSGEISNCLEECVACARTCTDTLVHCLQMGGAHAAVNHVQILLDCTQICNTTSEFMSRYSPQHGVACKACADICDRCATACDSFKGDDAMTACAKECRKCADSCRAAAPVALSAPRM